MSRTRTVFLTAEWQDLVMLNYEVDFRLLDKYVPCGTVLDSFLGKTYVSLVGFRFCRTKLFGSLSVPLHSDFDEVTLRFYVRRKEGDETRAAAYLADGFYTKSCWPHRAFAAKRQIRGQ